MVFTTTATTTVSVREAVLALASGTLHAFDLIHSGMERNDALATRSYGVLGTGRRSSHSPDSREQRNHHYS